MPRNIIRVNLALDRIHVHDEGDGLGSAEPYLWSVFFKIDGSTVQVTESFTLSGPPTVEGTPGSHGNLGNTDADEGDHIMIPPAIGEYDVMMSPIYAPSLPDLGLEFGGVVGVVAVLMEEDNVTDKGAEAGHAALDAAVRSALQRIIDTRSISNQDVSEEEINQFTASIGAAVEAAIVNQQNLFENLWSWLNPDDTIGAKVFLFTHDQLDEGANLFFSHRWKNEGDWEIFGHVTSTVACPAEASQKLIDAMTTMKPAAAGAGKQPTTPMKTSVDISPMRRFRDGDYRKYPGLGKWFALASTHSARVAYLVAQKPELAVSLRAMLEWGNAIAQKPDTKITDQQIEHAERLLLALEATSNPRVRIDASRARTMLGMMRGKTHREALVMLDKVEPARHPQIMGKRLSRSSLMDAIKRRK